MEKDENVSKIRCRKCGRKTARCKIQIKYNAFIYFMEPREDGKHLPGWMFSRVTLDNVINESY